MKWERYIGDGVYADFDGYHIVLKTERDIGGQNVIYLDPLVMSSLIGMNTEIVRAAHGNAEERCDCGDPNCEINARLSSSGSNPGAPK